MKMNSIEYEKSLNKTQNKVNLTYQVARITVKENLLGKANTQKPYFSQTISPRKKMNGTQNTILRENTDAIFNGQTDLENLMRKFITL